MAQSLKSKITKLAQAYNINAIIETAEQVKFDLADQAAWNKLTSDEKTQWFYSQCQLYNLTTKQIHNQIKVNELPAGKFAYFCVFLPSEDNFRGQSTEAWHLEIGGSYIGDRNGGIWPTSPGLNGKEKQIQQVMQLHQRGE